MRPPPYFLFCCLLGVFSALADEGLHEKPATAAAPPSAGTVATTTTTAASTASTSATLAATQAAAVAAAAAGNVDAVEAAKDKRQIGDKDTPAYPNQRADTNVDENDELEDAQETIYGAQPQQQFLIRPIGGQLDQQQQQQQQRQQLRNYPATIRPHAGQLGAEQSQEIQHFAYLQDISRNQPRSGGPASKLHTSASKKIGAMARLLSQGPMQQRYQSSAADDQAAVEGPEPSEGGEEEAEQRYAVAIRNPYLAHLSPQQQQQQQQHQLHPAHGGAPQPQQPYQVIPEEQFLKLLEEELRSRAYHDAQLRQHHALQAAADGKPDQPQRSGPSSPTMAESARGGHSLGLGGYRQRVSGGGGEEPVEQELVQYVPRHRGGPKYLPLPAAHQQQQHQLLQPEPQHIPEQELQQAHIPPQLAYYQPQISYKTLPNHPLAKSSLEREIEKLFEANKPSVAAVHVVDNSNEPSSAHHTHQQRHQPPPPPSQQRQQLLHSPTTKSFVATTTPNSLLDANNQPFIPSLFRFSNYQAPTAIYPGQQQQQHQQQREKLGPVVYPTQATPPAQATQYYYQDIESPTPTALPPSPKPKAYRSKHHPQQQQQQYGQKTGTPKSPRERHQKYAQSLIYEFEPEVAASPSPSGGFYPSPPDPLRPKSTHAPPSPPTTLATPATSSGGPPPDFRQYALPVPAPSQSSIYVSQGTGIATPSRPLHQHQHHQQQQQQQQHHQQQHRHRQPPPQQQQQQHHQQPSGQHPKTIEDVKQLQLPQPGGKPLTQAEFQALLDAGYPVTAVPVPVPVPYEQYVRDHPEFRQQRGPGGIDYAQLMRFAAQPRYDSRAGGGPLQGQHRQQHHHQHAAQASEPSVKIISSDDGAADEPSATGIGGGSVTYLRPIARREKQRRTRDEKETSVAGAEDKSDVVAVEGDAAQAAAAADKNE